MRKTLISLVLIIPMIFLLVVFSSANLVSLNVSISVNGIRIFSEDGLDEDNTLFIDMADDKLHKVEVELSPANATNRGFTLTSADLSVAEVTEEGNIIPKGEGTVEITATSNDKSFTDSLTAVVVSSKPYDFEFSLLDGEGKNVFKATPEGYEGEISAGTHSFDMAVKPLGFNDYSINAATSTTILEADKGAKTLFLPFSGEAKINVAVPDGVNGDIKKQVSLNVTKPAGVMLINGETDFSGLKLAYGATRTRLYVESDGTPQFTSDHADLIGEPTRLGSGRYILDIRVDAGMEEGFSAAISAGGQTLNFLFSFGEFDFSVFSDLPMQTESDGTQSVTVFTGNAASFYAVSALGADEIEYAWNFNGPPQIFTAEGATAMLTATSGGEKYTLEVTASYNGKQVSKLINISVVKRITAIQIANNVKADLAECYTVAGYRYNDDMTLEENIYKLKVLTYSSGSSGQSAAGEETVFTVSDDSKAKVEMRSDGIYLVPVGEGKVTVTAAWKGNEVFGTSVKATITVNVIKDAVAVKNAPELDKAVKDEKIVALDGNIALGTDKNGQVLSIQQRTSMLGRIKSTYNTEWYKHTHDQLPEGADNISYVMEFKNDIYGNGYSIDAGNFTHALDSSGVPQISLYKGPLYFVKFKEMASVAGQDNCAFLIRKDGVKLYGVNLLGCSDENLLSESGEYDLTNLNLTGTTLEINASVDIINCRIRNGRNVIRAYGGNRDGQKYFINSLAENTGCDSERIKVNIEGCIITQGREFILKIGANRALRASKMLGSDPSLTGSDNRPYAEAGTTNDYGELYKDDYFYSRYVMTDVTLKNSVLETSGLFTVGIESNFSGEFLYEGASDHQWRNFTRDWEYCGGTSFASVLRLEGDVRLYDWKDLALVDSSTLIESPVGALSEWLKLDIQKMLDYVSGTNPQKYGDVIERTQDGKQFVHGGIALYGGGRNYSAVDMTGLQPSLNDFMAFNINISVLSNGEGTMQKQGEILPMAAGKHDFKFYMYGKSSRNNYEKQLSDAQNSLKYKGVTRVSAF